MEERLVNWRNVNVVQFMRYHFSLQFISPGCHWSSIASQHSLLVGQWEWLVCMFINCPIFTFWTQLAILRSCRYLSGFLAGMSGTLSMSPQMETHAHCLNFPNLHCLDRSIIWSSIQCRLQLSWLQRPSVLLSLQRSPVLLSCPNRLSDHDPAPGAWFMTKFIPLAQVVAGPV